MNKAKKSTGSVWLVSEAKSHLSEVLRRAKKRGPQIIGTREQYIVVPREDWEEKLRTSEPLGKWLLDNSPKVDFTLPDRGASSQRSILFSEA